MSLDPNRSNLSPFPSTHWTLVAGAGADDTVRRQALGMLLRRYLPALWSFLVANYRFTSDRADDLVQGFLADKVLEQDLLSRADRTRGRFRNFLATALDRYALNELRREQAAKRSPAGGLASLEEHPGLDRPGPAAADAFDAAWARRVLQLALERMKAECGRKGREDVWEVFEARVLGPTLRGEPPVPLGEMVRRLGITPDQASNLVGTSKKMFARNLREVVGEYADGADADEEIRSIKQILSKADAGSATISCT